MRLLKLHIEFEVIEAESPNKNINNSILTLLILSKATQRLLGVINIFNFLS